MENLFEKVMFDGGKGIIFFDNGKAAIITYNWKCHLWGDIEKDEVDEYEYYNVQEIEIRGDGSEVVPLRNFSFVKTEEVNKILKKIRGYLFFEEIEWDYIRRHGLFRSHRDEVIAHIHRVKTPEEDLFDIETFSSNKRIDSKYDLTRERLEEILENWREQEEE